MKKLLLLFLVLCITVTAFPALSFADVKPGANAKTVGPDEMPDTNIFEDNGSVFIRSAYEQWLKEGVPEVIANEILKNNVAFVVNSTWCWNKTKREKTDQEPVFDANGQMLVPTSSVKKILGVSVSGNYATEDQIRTAMGGKTKSFSDPRGFMIFGENIDEVINKNPVSEGNIGLRMYKSFYDVQICIGKITWNDITPTEDDWQKARDRVYAAITLTGELTDYENRYIKEQVDEVNGYLGNLTLDTETLLPFNDTSLYTAFQRLITMGRLYAIERDYNLNYIDREMLKEKSIELFDFLADNHMSKNKNMDSNWFYNRITYPVSLGMFLIMFYDEIDRDRINQVVCDMMVRTGSNLVSNYAVKYDYYTDGTSGIPNTYSNYTNLLWQTATNYCLYLLVENTERMNDCLKYSTGIFETLKNSGNTTLGVPKDGVFTDGSFVFHSYYSYNTGYGYSFVGTIGPMVDMTAGTVFDIQNLYGFSNLYSWIEKSWMPFIYKNARTKITSGREAAQGLSGKANVMVKSLLLVAKNANDKEGRETILSLLKPLVDEYYDDYMTYERVPIVYYYIHPTLNYAINPLLDEIKESTDVKSVEPYNYSFYNMDKFVHKRDDYTFMLSMSSERIDKYEAINNEGYTDWYIADGMTYMMQDSQQYLPDWWIDVDRYKIPGTTVDSQTRNPTWSSYATIRPDNTWAGGASDGLIGVAAMKLPQTAANKTSFINGTKSYFMLDDKIVCMGTGISGGEGDVFTTVENYKDLKTAPDTENAERNNGYTSVSVDGESVPFTFDNKMSYKNPNYIALNNDRGYIFFGENDITVERVVKDKKYAGLNKTANESSYDVPFVTILAEHGTAPKNETYCYALVPSKTEEEVKNIAKNPGFEIVEQSDKRHVIKLDDGTVMANLFVSSELLGFSFKNPCSVIIKPSGSGYKLYVAEPTQKLKTLLITVPDGGTAVCENAVISGNTVKLNAGVLWGSTYEIDYFTENTETEQDVYDGRTDGNIRVWDMYLNIGNGGVSTKLYAKSIMNLPLTYEIANEDKINGNAYIKDGRLYYTPNISKGSSDTVSVKVYDSLNNSSEYKIIFGITN